MDSMLVLSSHHDAPVALEAVVDEVRLSLVSKRETMVAAEPRTHNLSKFATFQKRRQGKS